MIEFLRSIFQPNCKPEDYVVVSAKGKAWIDYPIQWKDFDFGIKAFLDTYPADSHDLYFSPHPYTEPRRLLDNASTTKYLAQDIDEADIPELEPTYVWESSPNKYQGIWELDRYITLKEYEPLNKAMAETYNFDLGCTDFTHVYRIPGSVNHKYKNKPDVSEHTYNKKIYRLKTIKSIVKPKEESTTITIKDTTDLVERKIYAKYSIPQKVREVLALTSLEGIDRSDTIWYVESKLYELGMEPNEIIHLIKNSAFNKYRGRKDEDKRLRAEMNKILEGKVTNSLERKVNRLKVSSYEDVMSNQSAFAGWLVKGFWGRRSHGIVAGMPKTLKSTLTHDLAVSVASGKPFLGKYEVMEPGPVIVIQNENADYIMKDRTEKLIKHKGLGGKVIGNQDGLNIQFPPELPIYFLNQVGFNMSDEGNRNDIEELIKEIKPVLVIFDPLYLMFEGDINSAQDLNPTLNWLLNLKNQYKTSVMLLHHYNKGGMNASKGGARMAGSIFLYSWIESAWYLSKEEEEEREESIDQSTEDASLKPTKVTLGREFRMAGSYPDLDIYLSMGEIGNSDYSVDVAIAGQEVSNIEEDIAALMALVKEQQPIDSKWMKDNHSWTTSRFFNAARVLEDSGKLMLGNGGYYLS